MESKWYGVLSAGTEWILRMITATVIWAMFVCLGAVVFGIMPATTSLFTVMRVWLAGDTQTPLFKIFFCTFKAEFIGSNLIGALLGMCALLAYINFEYCLHHDLLLRYFILAPTMTISSLLVVVVIYIFPVISQLKTTPIRRIWIALMLGLSHPFRTLGWIVVLVTYVSFLRGLIAFLLVSTVSLLVTKSVQRSLADSIVRSSDE